jgi:hypothetical protein
MLFLFSSYLLISIAPIPSENDYLKRSICPEFLEMISSKPTGTLENILLRNHEYPSSEFVARTYPLEYLLTLITNTRLHRSKKMGDINSLVGFLVGEEYDPYEMTPEGIYLYKYHYDGKPSVFLRRGDEARELLFDQYPQLATLQFTSFADEKEKRLFVWRYETRFGRMFRVLRKSI